MHPALNCISSGQIPNDWEVFEFNMKTAIRSTAGNFFLALIFLPMAYLLITKFSGDLEALIPGIVVGVFGFVMFVQLFRHIHWIKTKHERRIVITDSEVVLQWGQKVQSWNLSEVKTHISSVRGPQTGRTVGLDLINTTTQKREFLTDDHWIGNTDMIAYAINKKTAQ